LERAILTSRPDMAGVLGSQRYEKCLATSRRYDNGRREWA